MKNGITLKDRHLKIVQHGRLVFDRDVHLKALEIDFEYDGRDIVSITLVGAVDELNAHTVPYQTLGGV